MLLSRGPGEYNGWGEELGGRVRQLKFFLVISTEILLFMFDVMKFTS